MKFKIMYALFFFVSSYIYAYEYSLSICAIFQNEAPYLKEWIDYHEKKGVEHFILYNNNSTDNYKEVLRPYIKSGLVKLIKWESIQEKNDWHNFSFRVQTGAYNDAIKRSKGVTKWLAIIDTDEFIVPMPPYDNILQLLEKEYPQVSGLCVNWQCYGTSHIEKCLDGKILENLTMKMRWNHDWNKHSKSIVQPLHVHNCPNPHFCTYLSNHWAIDGNYNRCDSVPNSIYIDKIRINHYWTRDEWYLHNCKIPRYKKWGADIDGVLKHANEMNEEYDPIIKYIQ